MEPTTNDMQLLANEANKPIYETIYSLVVKEYENVLYGLKTDELDEFKMKAVGTCGLYLSSLVELLHTTKYLIDNGFIESAGATAAALWERALTLRKIMLDPDRNSQIHVEHEQVKRAPWGIFEMVSAVVNNEPPTKNASKEIECKMYYLQYTFLCSIKHGNPYTISHLNRPDRSSIEALYKVKPNDSPEDKDLKIYILGLCMDIALDAINDFSKVYRKNTNSLKQIRGLMVHALKNVNLNVSKIFITSPEEMGADFWLYLENLHNSIPPQ